MFGEFQHAHFFYLIGAAGIEKFYLISFVDAAIENTEQYLYAPISVVHRIKNHGLQWCLRVSLWSRNTLYNGIQNICNTNAFFGAGMDHIFTFAADEVYNLVGNFFGHGAGQVVG